MFRVSIIRLGDPRTAICRGGGVYWLFLKQLLVLTLVSFFNYLQEIFSLPLILIILAWCLNIRILNAKGSLVLCTVFWNKLEVFCHNTPKVTKGSKIPDICTTLSRSLCDIMAVSLACCFHLKDRTLWWCWMFPGHKWQHNCNEGALGPTIHHIFPDFRLKLQTP